MLVHKFDEIDDLLLHESYGYFYSYNNSPTIGWLLNFQLFDEMNDKLTVTLYFATEDKNKFMIKVPFYPSVILESYDNFIVEEYLLRKYFREIHHTERVFRKNPENINHLDTKEIEMIKIFANNERSLKTIIRDVNNLLSEKKSRENEILENLEEQSIEAPLLITGIHEFDIPYEVQIGVGLSINCGCWYKVIYDGVIHHLTLLHDKVGLPDLKIFAYDIETTKAPLKFSDHRSDPIMMISITTSGGEGYLINNRKFVGADLEDFVYSPKDGIHAKFKVLNEVNEEDLLLKFIKIIQNYSPQIITTFNGDMFDFNYIVERMKLYSLSFEKVTGFKLEIETFISPFIVHLDCYKWVKRDSYLPISSQGLKAATRAKLGYEPEEIDPEDMVDFAMNFPDKMAAYSVSDAVATYHLYKSYVHRHIFSMSSIIPLTATSVLSKGSATLCESLLISQAISYNVIVKPILQPSTLKFYKKKLVENMTYVGGHVESLKAGIHRSDFMHNFNINADGLKSIMEEFDNIFKDFMDDEDYLLIKENCLTKIQNIIQSSEGSNVLTSEGLIYHLDVEAMYPNIILTNRLQPDAMINTERCLRCDPSYNCERRMNWISRAETYPVTEGDMQKIVESLKKEIFYVYENGEERRTEFNKLPVNRKETIFKQKAEEYSKKVYRKSKIREENEESVIVCQRAIPFYVETVRKFKHQRLEYKSLYKKYNSAYSNSPTKENEEKKTIYNSLQIAYKCVLNSFYGYVMRKGARWYSMEMAAVTCYTGSQIIKQTKEFVSGFGIPLELDTDGIWTVIPKGFPSSVHFKGKDFSFLSKILNYFVCSKFTNPLYLYKDENSKNQGYVNKEQNLISFEADGPYKTMIIPSSTTENKLIKKRYAIFDFNDKIVELKGFELKRRGELGFVKKLQKEMFDKFNTGNTLEESYNVLGGIGNKWYDLIKDEGKNLTETEILGLFSDSRMMSKNITEYALKKSTIFTIANRLAEMLGPETLEGKLKCDFIVLKYPEGGSLAERVIPTQVFSHSDRSKYLRKWMGQLKNNVVGGIKEDKDLDLCSIVDWSYYLERLTQILQRLIVIPAFLQKIPNPIPRISHLDWMQSNQNKYFARNRINGGKEVLLSPNDRKIDKPIFPEVKDNNINKEEEQTENISVISIFKAYKGDWISYYNKKVKGEAEGIYKMTADKETNKIILEYYDGKVLEVKYEDLLLINVNEDRYFENKYEVENMRLPDSKSESKFYKIKMAYGEMQEFFKNYLRDHFSVKQHFLPYKNICPTVLVDSFFTIKDYTIISGISIKGKSYFYATEITDNQIGDILYYKKISNINSPFVIISFSEYNSPCIKELISIYSKKVHFIPINLLKTILLGKKEEDIYRNFHNDIYMKFSYLKEISNFINVPLFNLLNNSIIANKVDLFYALDIFYFKELLKGKIIPICREDDLLDNSCTKEIGNICYYKEFIRPGYHYNFTIQVELSNSLILSIINSNEIMQIDRNDFIILKNMLKSLIYKSSTNPNLSVLLTNLPYWFYKKSKYVSQELQELVSSLHYKYILNLVKGIKLMQIEVFAVSKEALYIDTGKTTIEGSKAFFDYLNNYVETLEGYEMLQLSLIRTMGKIGFISPILYFYLDISNNEIIFTSESVNIPNEFLIEYFKDDEITKINQNDFIYDVVIRMKNQSIGIKTLKALLYLLRFRRETYGLASNCYKLYKSTEFDTTVSYRPPLTIFCNKCLFENYLNEKCVKCLNNFGEDYIESECIKYLRYCWYHQLKGDRYCNVCGSNEEMRLKEYCKCGGEFISQDYLEEVSKIKNYVNESKKVSELFMEMFSYFSI